MQVLKNINLVMQNN
jgi:ABC-type nitrate/sulfonate/bicarbonate transport system ATPase subunit